VDLVRRRTQILGDGEGHLRLPSACRGNEEHQRTTLDGFDFQRIGNQAIDQTPDRRVFEDNRGGGPVGLIMRVIFIDAEVKLRKMR
jgi:hypothetical protein